MGREVRMVPADWQHPKDDGGRYIPLYDGSFLADAQQEWDEGLALWMQGLRDDFNGGTERHEGRPDIYGWTDYTGRRPAAEDYMPDWPAEQRTHFMMYEDTSEGTPKSPAFATPEELAQWLVDNEVSAFADQAANYESWLRVARGGFAPSAVFTSEGMQNGVDALTDSKAP